MIEVLMGRDLSTRRQLILERRSQRSYNMNFVLAFTWCMLLIHQSQAILKIDDPIPATWGSNYRYSRYVKDKTNCHFGYEVSLDTNQVINIFNCTYDDEDVFYSLKALTCATADHVQRAETCEFTPDLSNDDNDMVPDDRACLPVREGVAPAPENCCMYNLCTNDGLVRVGRRMCPRGQYFSSQSYRCEHLWRDGENGAIIPLSEQAVCGNRTMPVDRRRNYGAIIQKCLWNWDFTNTDTYSVAEPLNCQLYYLCSAYNPSYVVPGYTSRCPGSNYWSNSAQACVPLVNLTLSERQDCGV